MSGAAVAVRRTTAAKEEARKTLLRQNSEAHVCASEARRGPHLACCFKQELSARLPGRLAHGKHASPAACNSPAPSLLLPAGGTVCSISSHPSASQRYPVLPAARTQLPNIHNQQLLLHPTMTCRQGSCPAATILHPLSSAAPLRNCPRALHRRALLTVPPRGRRPAAAVIHHQPLHSGQACSQRLPGLPLQASSY